MSEINGKVRTLDTPRLQSEAQATTKAVADSKGSDPNSKQSAKAKSRGTRGKTSRPHLKIDAGSTNVKYWLERYFDSFPSLIREFSKSQIVPEGRFGVFARGEQGYAVGDSATSTSGGKLWEGFADDSKIKRLNLWIIGALTMHPDFLEQLISKIDDEVVKISLDLTILSLSNNRKKEIESKLQDLSFTMDGRKFEVKIENYTIRPEAFGAACVATKLMKGLAKKYRAFHVLDLGGGTLTLSRYPYKKGDPKSNSQKSMSGAGVIAIADFVAEEAMRGGDTGGVRYELSRIREGLNESYMDAEGKYHLDFQLDKTDIDLGDKLIPALDNWARELIGVKQILRDVRQILRKGEFVFLTGGGFEIAPIEDYIRKYLGKDAEALVITLENPGSVNVDGIK